MRILVTGAAGFIGFHLTKRLCNIGHEIVGLDNINDYYDVNLKYARLLQLGIDKEAIIYNSVVGSNKYSNYSFIKLNLEDKSNLDLLFEKYHFDAVCNLAAQAGVRYSIENPYTYISSNVVGFLNILECCRHNKIGHLVYASSSSVYGLNENYPFKVTDECNHPVSLYAATKKANELMSHTYSHLYQIPTTGLRFFTVYGPWGRPDMALFLFTKSILEGKLIDVFNNGHHKRDFTFVDDTVEGVVRTLDKVAASSPDWSGKDPDPATSLAPYRVYNIGNNTSVNLLDFIAAIENALGRKAQINMLPMQAGDMEETYADIEALSEAVGFRPLTPIEEGIEKFVRWYRDYYQC